MHICSEDTKTAEEVLKTPRESKTATRGGQGRKRPNSALQYACHAEPEKTQDRRVRRARAGALRERRSTKSSTMKLQDEDQHRNEHNDEHNDEHKDERDDERDDERARDDEDEHQNEREDEQRRRGHEHDDAVARETERERDGR